MKKFLSLTLAVIMMFTLFTPAFAAEDATSRSKVPTTLMGYTQYMVYDAEKDTMSVMTEENCNTEKWVARDEIDNPEGKKGRLAAFLRALMNWLTNLFNMIREKLF